MKYRVLFASLAVAIAACGSSKKKDSDESELPAGARPEVEAVVEALYEVVDEKGRQRVGFVEKTSYDSGRIVFWVYGPKYREKLGYLLPNNRAVAFEWQAGERTKREIQYPADTMNSNIRRVLQYTDSIAMVPVEQTAIAKEMLDKRYAKPEKTEGEGCGCGG
ncbi:MAG: hypothetical protein ACYTGN_04465 [Planctomycetota bacterium]|jgi:hypothetical protein